MLHEELREACQEYTKLNQKYVDSFQEFLQWDLPESFPITELKRGLEEGLNINEIAVLLGKDARDTHENKKIYIRYRNFFKGKLESGYAESVRAYIHAIRTQADFDVPTELILYVNTVDEAKEVAPVIKLSSEELKFETGGAYYLTVGMVSPDGELLYRCFLPSDRDFYETKQEGDAKSWVNEKNNRPMGVRQIRKR